MDLKYTKDNGVYGNQMILDKLRNDEVFSVSRMGLAEVRWVDWYLRGGLDFNCDGSLFSANVYTPTLFHRLEYNGIYGNSGEFFLKQYISGIETGDINIFWFHTDGSNLVYDEQINIFNNISRNSTKVGYETLCPYLHTDFWTKGLSNKKVLVVHPFVETIRNQYKKKEKIWTGNHANKLPDFELVLYKPIWSFHNERPHSSWEESFKYMVDEISNLDFDVAILSCSHFGLPLLSHIRNVMKKSAIYMGGETQILFGIKGTRWDERPNVTMFYNENWTRSIDEIPNNFKKLDMGCYW